MAELPCIGGQAMAKVQQFMGSFGVVLWARHPAAKRRSHPEPTALAGRGTGWLLCLDYERNRSLALVERARTATYFVANFRHQALA